MKTISNYAGLRVDYVQGGGGNTSYKFNDQLMAIKASGYTLKEVEEEAGYVTVDYAKIKDQYASLMENENVDVEKETLAINLESINLLEGMDNLRPSVEVGFHSYLPRAVVHTHSVCSNLLCCSEEGRDTAKKIFGVSEFGYIYIPFINPGYMLSMHIKDEVAVFKAKNGKLPDLIFMESHGIIASNDDFERAMEIHEKANQMIIDHFSATAFPIASIKKTEDGVFSDTPFIHDFIMNFSADNKYFDEVILYPDQMVYLAGNLGKTIIVDKKNNTIQYKVTEKLAQTIEELILGVAYIISEISRNDLTLKLLCDEGIDFIRNWESEKYRASLVK